MSSAVVVGILLVAVVTIPILAAATGTDIRETPRLIRDKSRQRYQASKERIRPKVVRVKQSLKKRLRHNRHSENRMMGFKFDGQNQDLRHSTKQSVSESENFTQGTGTEPLSDAQELWNTIIFIERRETESTENLSAYEMESRDGLGRTPFSRLVYVPYDWGCGQHFRIDMNSDMSESPVV